MRFKSRVLLISVLCFTKFLGTPVIAQSDDEQMRLSDAPTNADQQRISSEKSYQEILENWDHVDSVNQWIGKYFGYDMSRALKLGEGSDLRSKTKILTPEEFYENPNGVCLDLSRFAVETLRKMPQEYEANYLMIEFEPITIKGSTLSKHWIAVYKDQNGLFNFTADSKYPGRKYEGYSDVASFVSEYETLRDRKILRYQIVPTYEKKKKKLKKAK
ncbi:MAG: transglutaminase-like domain-containing protein [Ekhidna sp.]